METTSNTFVYPTKLWTRSKKTYTTEEITTGEETGVTGNEVVVAVVVATIEVEEEAATVIEIIAEVVVVVVVVVVSEAWIKFKRKYVFLYHNYIVILFTTPRLKSGKEERMTTPNIPDSCVTFRARKYHTRDKNHCGSWDMHIFQWNYLCLQTASDKNNKTWMVSVIWKKKERLR